MKLKASCGVVLVVLCATVAIAKDKTEYQVGTFMPVHNTSTFSVHMYAIRVDGGIWMVQSVNEKPTPLDNLNDGDKVMFRVHEGRDPVGKSLQIYIPYADNPKKESEFVAHWLPDIPPPAPDSRATRIQEIRRQCCSYVCEWQTITRAAEEVLLNYQVAVVDVRIAELAGVNEYLSIDALSQAISG